MRHRILSLFTIGLWGLWAVSVSHAQDVDVENKPVVNDVRILIDVSGSMKKNDPKGLREPSLRLLTQLLPEGSRSGVWTFGKYVNMLVKSGEVNADWKEKAYKAINQIHSKGLFTNIEDVLEKSTWDWHKPDENANRNIIFLTDGVVDISKDKSVNDASRKRIIENTLHRLHNAGVKIHTIALSEGADRAFLRQLSATTTGWYEQVESADDLERIFFKLFEKSVPVESLPLKDNKVLVDNSIKELTLLIFRKEGAESAIIIQPNAEQIDHKTKRNDVRWQHEKRYDLVTIDNPMAGEWRVNAELDPDNRVMVVADMNVRASRLPNVMMNDDVIPYYVELHQHNEVIKKKAFLDLVKIALNRDPAEEQEKTLVLMDDGADADKKSRDGRYSAIIKGIAPGEYQYELVVDGTTFKRSKQYALRVVDKPVTVTVEELEPGNPAHFALTMSAYSELIKPESLLIDTKVAKEGGGSAAVNIPRTGPNEWRLDLDIKQGEYFNVTLSAQAERLNGKSETFELGSYRMGSGVTDEMSAQEQTVSVDADAQEKTEEPAGATDEMKNKESMGAMSDEKPVSDAKHDGGDEMKAAEHMPEAGDEGKAEDGLDTSNVFGFDLSEIIGDEMPGWLSVTLKIVAFNGVLFLVGFIAYRKWFRSPVKEEGLAEGQAGDAAANGGGDDVADLLADLQTDDLNEGSSDGSGENGQR